MEQRGDGEALASRALLGADLELPIAFGRGDIGLADDDAALVLVLKVNGEIGHLPGGLGAALTEDHERVLEAEPRQVGGIALARAVEHLGDGAGQVELAAACCRRFGALGDDRLRRGGRALVGRRPFGRQRAADQRLALACGGLLEGQGETLLLIVEHQQARADEVDASRREPPAEQRRAAHADGGERGLRDDRAVLVDQPDVAQAEQHAGPVGGARQDRVVDLDVHVGELAVDRVLDGRHQARQRDRTARKPAVAEHDGDQTYDQNAGEDFAADTGAARRELGKLDLDRRRAPASPAPCPARATQEAPCHLR